MQAYKLSGLLIGACLFASAAQAATIPWSNPSGATSTFTWANGGNDTNLFGSPTVIGNSFVFFPSNFKAQSSNGVADQKSDRLEVDIVAKPGFTLQGLNVQEFGDYGILGTGSVQAFGSIFATNLLNATIQADSLHTTPAMPITAGSGQWSGTETIDYTAQGVTAIHIVLDNVLQANSGANSTAFIEKKVADIGIKIEVIVPEPASLGLLAFAAPLFIRRRK